jgi:4-amino-4-deoxy-L-arabinose transferase-like glycosyltransferase
VAIPSSPAQAGVQTSLARPVSASSIDKNKIAWIAVLAIFCLVYAGSLFSPALLDDADATHAEAAREMFVTGDWVTLHIDGVRYLEKAPLLYWLIAFCYKCFGVSELSARLPLVISILGILVLAGTWSRRAFGEPAGILAALFVTTSVGFYLFTRIIIPEGLLSLLIGLSFYFIVLALNSRPERQAVFWYAAYASLALAILTKGLLSLVIVGGTLFLFVLITGSWRRWREFRLLSGTLLFLAIAAPWHLLAGFRNHGFFWFYFVNEHFLRFLGRRYPKDYNKLPALAYWGLHFVWLFPWSMFLPLTMRNLILTWRERDRVVWDFPAQTRLLCFLWAAVTLIFFSFSTNQEYYTFPAYLPLAMLTADAVTSPRLEGSRLRSIGYSALTIIGVMAAIALGLGLWWARALPFQPDVGSVLVQRGVGNYTLSMSRFFDLTGASFAGLRLPAVLAAIAFLVGPVTALILHMKKKGMAAAWAIAGFAALFLFAAHIALVRFEPFLSSRALASQVKDRASPHSRFMIHGDQSYGSSWIFYLQQQVYLVDGRTTSMEFGSRYPDAPKIFLNDPDLVAAWGQEKRIFLFAPLRKAQQLEGMLGPRIFRVAQTSANVVYSNQP